MKLLLCILDGVGIRDEEKGNAVCHANMPNFKRLLNEYPNCLLEASGKEVGLPEGQMGNSEVGHTNIGAGRLVYQPLELINSKIDNKEFFSNENLLSVMNYTKENKSKLHIMGLLSDGGIHSHINHLFALLDMCKKEGINDVCLHMYLDGRDTLPTVGIKYLDELSKKIKEVGIGKICTLSGRYYAMDRDNNYDRLQKAYDAIVYGKGEKYSNYQDAVKANLDRDIWDEFTIPCVLDEGKIENKDGVIFFNFRPDRLRELGVALTNPKFKEFPHKNLDIKLVTMMPVDSNVINTTAYDVQKLDNTFGEYISKKGLTQLRIAETEKYAHVTYFFDGGVERKLKGAHRKLIASPKVATYDMKPEMSAYKITATLLKEMKKYDVVILNFANGDMVGHTGDMAATIKGLEVIDECIGKIFKKVTELGGILAITADHGNSDYMIDEAGNIVTSHSTSKVPFIITKDDINLRDGKLGDIAPTLLTIMGLEVPSEMTGEILTDCKKKTKVSIVENIIRIFSMIFILSSIFFYMGRFGYFYYLEHKIVKYNESSIYTKLSEFELEDCTNNYTCYKGKVNDNYLYYKGIMWRIVGYDEEKVRLISNETLTSLKYKTVDKWLEDFKTKLNSPYITNIGLLTREEYEDSILPESYMFSDNYWWIEDYFVNKDNKLEDVDDNYYGVKPVIEISNKTIIVNGIGTSSSPFTLEVDKSYNLGDVALGSYVNFSDSIWRVVDIDSNGVKLASCNLLDEHIYSKKDKIFDVNEKGSLANYLNTTYLNSISNKDKIVKAKWKVNKYSEGTNYDYTRVVKTVEAYVGLLNIGDLFINDQYNYTLLTEGDGKFTYRVNPYNRLYLDFKTSSRKIRPAIYLSSDLLITGGNGRVNNPYLIEE